MDLLRHIRSDRAGRRGKEAFRPSLFTRINALVQAHALDETFLGQLAAAAAPPPEDHLPLDTLIPKHPFQPPLFCLSTEAQYRVTIVILRQVDNPYLHFVASPDEILLCAPLFRMNPSLPAGALGRHHFKTLLFAEIARQHMPELPVELRTILAADNLHDSDRSYPAPLHQAIGNDGESLGGPANPAAT